MPTKTGKSPATYYKNDLTIDQSTNTGIDSTTRRVQDGDGNDTSISLSDDVLQVQPINDSTTGTLTCKSQSGSTVFAVDTTNSKVLVGASQVAVNTNYAYFGVSSTSAYGAVAGTHYAVPFGNTFATSGHVTLGTGTEPSTSYDVSANNNSDDLTMTLWYIPDNITVDQVYWFAGGSAASGDTINIHLLAFDIDKGVGAGKGDLSNGVVVAGGADKASLGYENIIYETIAPASANVDAGQVCIATFETSGTNSDYALNIIVKYRIR
tara:strand:+ start:772 stop:1569 length:798 start_codon:yes stop_codon:yes gene_type:complete